MAGYRLEEFAVGETHDLEHEGQVHRLELIQAEALPASVLEEGGFRLEFRGPFEPVLAQATYQLRQDGEDRYIFIVPIAREPEGTRYEAVFY